MKGKGGTITCGGKTYKFGEWEITMTETIWVLNRSCGGYSGESDRLWEETEAKLLGCERSYDEDYYQKRKTYFKTRKDAEDYALPIAQKIWYWFIQNMKDNKDEDDDGADIALWEKRGFQMVQQEKLTPDNPLYRLYSSEKESTTFICPAEHEYDRMGQYFGGISKATLYG